MNGNFPRSANCVYECAILTIPSYIFALILLLFASFQQTSKSLFIKPVDSQTLKLDTPAGMENGWGCFSGAEREMNVHEKRGGKRCREEGEAFRLEEMNKGRRWGKSTYWMATWIYFTTWSLLTRRVRIDLKDLGREDVFLFVATVTEDYGYFCI